MKRLRTTSDVGNLWKRAIHVLRGLVTMREDPKRLKERIVPCLTFRKGKSILAAEARFSGSFISCRDSSSFSLEQAMTPQPVHTAYTKQ